MLVASELKGELARIRPARPCCRRAELAGLLHGAGAEGRIRTLDHATARIAVQLAASIGLVIDPPRRRRGAGPRAAGRHHLEVSFDRAHAGAAGGGIAKACDRRAFLRGVLLGAGSISGGRGGPHVEFVFTDRARANDLRRVLAQSEVQAPLMQRRGRHVVYLKGQEPIAALLQLTGANRALLEFETSRVSRDVQNRLNRLLNAEEANLGRTVRAADRQLQAIARLEAAGELDELPDGLREAAAQRRRQPDADLDTLATGLGIGRSAMNHRLRRLVELAAESTSPRAGR